MSKLLEYPDDGPTRQEGLQKEFLEWAISHCRSTGRPVEDAYAALEMAKGLRRAGVFEPGEVILAPGGTMLSRETPNGLAPGVSVGELLESPSSVSYSKLRADTKTYVGAPGSEFDFGASLDSTDCRLSHVVRLVEIIERYLRDPEINRMIIISGTDTLAYTLAALAQMIQHPRARIVVTGSMDPPGKAGSDAGLNINRARFLADDRPNEDPRFLGCIGERIADPRHLSKVHSSRREAFTSLGAFDIGVQECTPDGWITFERTVPTLNECREVAAQYRTLLAIKSEAWRTGEIIFVSEGKDSTIGGEIHTISDRSLLEMASRLFPAVQRYIARGGTINPEDLLDNTEMKVDTRYDNSALWEQLYEGYHAQWLEDLLSIDKLRGVILSGIETLGSASHRAICEVIGRHSAKKPIVIQQNPAAIENSTERDLQEDAVRAGAFLSDRMTIEWASILMKRLLAQTGDPGAFKQLWKVGGKIGAPPPIENLMEGPSIISPYSLEPLRHHIRIINLNFDHPPSFLRAAIMREDVDGAVIRGFGPGNLPDYLREVIEEAVTVKPCVIASLIDGPQHTQYAVGTRAVQLGMLPAGSLNAYQAARKLDLLLEKTDSLTEIRYLWSIDRE